MFSHPDIKKPHTLNMLFFIILFLAGSGLCHAQPTPQNLPPDAAGLPPGAVSDKTAPLQQTQQEGPPITLQGNQLSVNFVDTEFGDIIRTLSMKAGFKIVGSSSVFSRKVTTRFNDLDLEKGLKRLFTLVNESNYRIDYDSKGAISNLKIYGIVASRDLPQAAGATGRPATSGRATRRNVRQRIPGDPSAPQPTGAFVVPPPQPNSLFSQPPQVPQPIETPEHSPDTQDPLEAQSVDPHAAEPHVPAENTPQQAEVVREIPYTPPQAKKPLYPFRIPAIKR